MIDFQLIYLFFFFNLRLIFNVPFPLLLLFLLFFTSTFGLFPYLPFNFTYFSMLWLLAINSSALLLDPSSSPFLRYFIRYWIWLIDTSTLRVSVFISCLYSFLRCLFHSAAKAVPHLPLILSSLWLILHSPVLFFPLGVHRCWCWYVRIADVVQINPDAPTHSLWTELAHRTENYSTLFRINGSCCKMLNAMASNFK